MFGDRDVEKEVQFGNIDQAEEAVEIEKEPAESDDVVKRDVALCESGQWCFEGMIYPIIRTHCSSRYTPSHQALDVGSDSSTLRTKGQQILASWPGTVEKSWMDPDTEKKSSQGLGNTMVVEYRYSDIPAEQRPAWLAPGESIYVRYSHLDQRFVNEGQTLKPGDEIGTVGETGLATGPHIHMEVKSDRSESYSSFSRLQAIHNPLEVFPSICTD